ncbi:MAG: site-specific integrase, partial [Anaerolineales bacterium]|nr:site-specific integrase [Anaerolineales bacterium]
MPKTAAPFSLGAKSTLPPAIQAWASYLADQGSSLHTVKAFTGDVRLLASFLPADQPVGSITTNDLNNFLEWMQHKRGVECSPKTLSRRITSLKGFFRWLQAGGAVLADPAERVVQRSVLSPLPAVLNEAALQNVLAVAARQRRGKQGDARAYTLLALLLSTGIKKGETLALKTNHVDLDAAEGPLLFVRYPSPKDR